MTYSSERGGFTKITTPHQPGLRMYVSSSEMVGNIPGQGWMQIPPQVREMFLCDLGSDQLLGDAVPGMPTTLFNMSNMPRQMAEPLSWGNLRQDSERLEVDAEINAAPCPGTTGGSGCVTVSHATGALVYDGARRLVQLRSGRQTITFEYGAFNISLPPSW